MMPSDTQKRLQEIEARAKAATPGSWEAAAGADGSDGVWYKCTCGFGALHDHHILDALNGEENADFIAHSREDVPFLLALVSRYAGAIAEIEALKGTWASLTASHGRAEVIAAALNAAANDLDRILATLKEGE